MPADACARASLFFSMTLRSSPLSAVRRSDAADSTLARSAASTLSPRPCSDFSTAWIKPSALLRVSTSSRKRLSSSACASASRTMRLISSSVSPLEALMTIFCSLPVALSLAETLRMPLASMSKDTSTCGMPRGAGGMSVRSNLPSDLLSAARTHGLLHQVLHQGLELGARQLDVEMLRSRGIGGDVRQVDVGLLGRGQLDLRLLGGLLQALHGERVLAHVDAGLLLELLGQEIDDAQIEVLAAEEGIPVGRQHFELPLAVDFRDLDDGDVEGAATEVVDGDLAIAPLLVEPVGERRSGRLVDDALDREARDAAGVLGRLALRIVEVGRHGDDRFAHRLTEIVLGGLLHFHEHARRDLRRRHLLALHLDPGVAVVRADDLVGDHLDVPPDHLVLELAADEALDGEQGVVGIGHGLALGGLSHHHLAVLGKGDDGGGGAIALAVLDHPGLAALYDGHARVGRAEVDTDYLCHGFTPRNLCQKRDAWATSLGMLTRAFKSAPAPWRR